MPNLVYKLDEEYTYADYLSWEVKDRYEIINGVAYAMASPTVLHQEISRELMSFIGGFLNGKPCRVIAAPFDVRLFPEEDSSDTTVVQPDILVVCDSEKLSDGKACKGAPDLVIEILSRSSAIIDRNVKFEKYRQAGVKEYWIVNAGIVDPENAIEVMVNVLTNGQYISTVYRDKVPSSVLPGLVIDLSAVMANVQTMKNLQ